jgi:arylsulfatase A-like enzyme
LLTGRYPVRSGGWSMPASEITVGQLLQQAGYTTACIGKWDVCERCIRGVLASSTRCSWSPWG